VSESIITPLRPDSAKWYGPIDMTAGNLGFECYAWQYRGRDENFGLQVMSGVEVAHDPGQIDKGPEYHISISFRPGGGKVRRASTEQTKFVLYEFGALDGWDEDNHVPYGHVRNFWRPVAESLIGLECACKDEEPVVVEDKGEYIWRGITK
jgi:hypothetical protein